MIVWLLTKVESWFSFYFFASLVCIYLLDRYLLGEPCEEIRLFLFFLICFARLYTWRAKCFVRIL